MRRLLLLLLPVFLGAVVLARVGHGGSTTSPEGAKPARRILFYRDPMHPWYTSKSPGRAPDCGMALEPVYSDDSPSRASPPGSVALSSAQQQLIGVSFATVAQQVTEQSFRTTGRVTAEENRIYSVNAGADGWVREVYDHSTGSFVQKGAPLARLFSRDFLTPQQSYLYALESTDPRDPARSRDPQQAQVAQFQLRQASDALRDLGLAADGIETLRQTRQVASEILVRAPATGFVLSRNASPGQRFSKGDEFYRIADLSRVWILADITGEEADFIHAGERAGVFLDGKQTSVAIVTQVLPQFDPVARTLRVRLETANPDFELRPDRLVDVSFKVSLPPAIVIPTDAIIDSGLRKIVYVETGNGSIAPRTIQTGWRFNDRVQVREGLQPGDRVVTSGNFLIDSESRLRVGGL